MALYRLQESSSLNAEALLESLLYEGQTIIESEIAEAEAKLKRGEERLISYTRSLEENEKELKKLIESKPKSWLERKLESFKNAIEKFEAKYVHTKDGKTKGIIKKILSILTRIVKYINEKLLKLTRYVSNKFFNKEEKLKDHHKKIKDKKIVNKYYKQRIDNTKDEIDYYKNHLVDLENDKSNR